ncbi:MAG: SRPBCC family protein [Actinobacteria bacterium]|nr:SRPBCC family protein [Actinomycetota bacterium]
MPGFKVSLIVKQPPEVVARALGDPENTVRWTSGLQRFEVVKGNSGETGALARLHYVERGREYVMEDYLEYCAPEKKYVSRVSGNGMNVRVETILTPVEDGTEIAVFWSGTSDSLPAGIILPFMGGVIKRRALADLKTFKNLVEEHGARFPRA